MLDSKMRALPRCPVRVAEEETKQPDSAPKSIYPSRIKRQLESEPRVHKAEITVCSG